MWCQLHMRSNLHEADKVLSALTDDIDWLNALPKIVIVP